MCSNPTTARFSGPRQVTTLKQPKSEGRTLRFMPACNGTVCDRLTITTLERGRKVVEVYHLLEIPSDIGRGFAMQKKSSGETHLVHIGGNGLVDCDCHGFDLGGFCCRHIAALTKCLDTGRIAGGIPAAGDDDELDGFNFDTDIGGE